MADLCLKYVGRNRGGTKVGVVLRKIFHLKFDVLCI